MNDLRFNSLASLHWLWLLLAMIVLVVFAAGARRRRLAAFASDEVLARLIPVIGAGRQLARSILVLVATFLLAVSLLDPRWGVIYQEVRQQGIDIMVLLDVSRSMLAEDLAPNRLERSKQYVHDLVDRLGGDRVGLVTFAGNASLACPLTVDYGAFHLSLGEATPTLQARGGSRLGDALTLAGESFSDDVEDFKAVIVLTDGEDHGSEPLEAARRLFDEKGIRVHTVGIGDAGEGARIPVIENGQRSYLTHEGEQVWSKMDADGLRRMARDAGGVFIPVGTSNVDLGEMYEEQIAPVTRREFGTAKIRRRHARYQWFAGVALVLLLVESLVGDGTRREVA